MIAAGEPRAAVARTLRVGRTTLYRHLPVDRTDDDSEQAAARLTGGQATRVGSQDDAVNELSVGHVGMARTER
jgi:hypothetical protein